MCQTHVSHNLILLIFPPYLPVPLSYQCWWVILCKDEDAVGRHTQVIADVLSKFIWCFTHTSLSQVCGPKSRSFLFVFPESYCKGNLLKLYQNMTAFPKGDIHKQQRKILNPGFGAAESQTFSAISQASTQSAGSPELLWTPLGKVLLMFSLVPSIMQRPAGKELSRDDVQHNIVFLGGNGHLILRFFLPRMNIFSTPSVLQIFIQEALKYIPKSIVKSWVKYTPNHHAACLCEVNNVVTATARSMVIQKAESLLQGKGSRDIFMLLVKANMDTEVKNKLSDEELYSQMQYTSVLRMLDPAGTGLKAGNTVETHIRDKAAQETLWYHCVVPQLYCMAAQEYILPLSQPITMESASVAACNCNKDMWGEDADMFDLHCWLDGIAKDKKEAATRIYLNLIIEVQAFLEAKHVRHKLCLLVMVPAVEGEISGGVQLLLAISVTLPDDHKLYHSVTSLRGRDGGRGERRGKAAPGLSKNHQELRASYEGWLQVVVDQYLLHQQVEQYRIGRGHQFDVLVVPNTQSAMHTSMMLDSPEDKWESDDYLESLVSSEGVTIPSLPPSPILQLCTTSKKKGFTLWKYKGRRGGLTLCRLRFPPGSLSYEWHFLLVGALLVVAIVIALESDKAPQTNGLKALWKHLFGPKIYVLDTDLIFAGLYTHAGWRAASAILNDGCIVVIATAMFECNLYIPIGSVRHWQGGLWHRVAGTGDCNSWREAVDLVGSKSYSN
ncbi:hypothetical protein F5141DRAFT_1063613 [Pisolithus sp. B1]|nr:hypothetical protein F5141DRAFT_1063613 [Pisolithus sp. B1]